MTGGYQGWQSEDGKWCNYDEFNVFLILEYVAETTAIAWDIGMVVVHGVMQFE